VYDFRSAKGGWVEGGMNGAGGGRDGVAGWSGDEDAEDAEEAGREIRIHGIGGASLTDGNSAAQESEADANAATATVLTAAAENSAGGDMAPGNKNGADTAAESAAGAAQNLVDIPEDSATPYGAANVEAAEKAASGSGGSPAQGIVDASDASDASDLAGIAAVDATPGSSYIRSIDVSSLDNRKIGWGVRLNGNKQPEVPRGTVSVLDKYGAIFMGNAEDKSVYLTIDQGYEIGYTSQILDTLKANGVDCAFFITGDYLNRNADLVKRMLDEGYIIGNHSDKHTSFPDKDIDKVRKELRDLEGRFYETFDRKMTYMRPPNGEYSERVLAICAQEGYRAVMWSLTYEDYDVNNQKGEAYAYNKLMDNLHSGAVILLHAVSKDNANILDRFIKDAKALGYCFKSLDDFIR